MIGDGSVGADVVYSEKADSKTSSLVCRPMMMAWSIGCRSDMPN